MYELNCTQTIKETTIGYLFVSIGRNSMFFWLNNVLYFCMLSKNSIVFWLSSLCHEDVFNALYFCKLGKNSIVFWLSSLGHEHVFFKLFFFKLFSQWMFLLHSVLTLFYSYVVSMDNSDMSIFIKIYTDYIWLVILNHSFV